MTRLAVQAVLDRLAEDLGLDALDLGEEGRVVLTFDETIDVEIGHDEEQAQLVLHAEVGAIVPGRETHTALELLEANLFWHRTGGATLAVDRQSLMVVLCQALPAATLGPEDLPRALETFVATVEYWRGALADVDAAPANDPEMPPDARVLV